MVRRILLLSLLGMLLPMAAGAQFIIVTRTGAQIPARRQPTFDKSLLKFQSMRGTNLTMNVVNLDIEETERVNGVDLPVKVESLQKQAAAVPESSSQYGWEIPMSARATMDETYTNAKLRSLRVRRSVFVESGQGIGDVEAVAASQREEIQGPEDPGSRADWQSRAQVIRNRQTELNRRRTVLRQEAQKYQRAMAGQDASATQKLGAQLDKTNQELALVERELSQLSQEWDRLQREARSAGVPDSWLR